MNNRKQPVVNKVYISNCAFKKPLSHVMVTYGQRL